MQVNFRIYPAGTVVWCKIKWPVPVGTAVYKARGFFCVTDDPGKRKKIFGVTTKDAKDWFQNREALERGEPPLQRLVPVKLERAVKFSTASLPERVRDRRA